MNKPARPALLSVLCVLTFIGSGLSAIGNFIASGMKGFTQAYLDSGDLTASLSSLPNGEEMIEKVEGIMEHYFIETPSFIWIITGLLYIASIVGASLMWKMKRNGFHLYTIAQCLILILGIVVNRSQGFPYNNFIWTALFVGLYATTLKYMPGKDDIITIKKDSDD